MRIFPAVLWLVVLTLSACSRDNGRQAAAETSAGSGSQSQQTQEQQAKIARGQYLAENLMDCFTCHSPMDYKGPTPQVVAGQKGAGTPFDFKGLPFPVYVPNITSDPETGAGKWTDEQITRSIREGIGHDGRVLFPIMPYMLMRAMSDEDASAVVAYLRTLPPVNKPTVTPTIPDEVRKQLPTPPPLAKPVAAPDRSDKVKYGEYLAMVAACADCHTPFNQKMEPIHELAFSGGFVMEGTWGKVASANITPDPSGISYYDENKFIEVIRTGHNGARALNPIMPWWRYRNLTDDDLKDIYAYIRTLKPIKHRVDNTEAPTLCKICGAMHGGGKLN